MQGNQLRNVPYHSIPLSGTVLMLKPQRKLCEIATLSYGMKELPFCPTIHIFMKSTLKLWSCVPYYAFKTQISIFPRAAGFELIPRHCVQNNFVKFISQKDFFVLFYNAGIYKSFELRGSNEKRFYIRILRKQERTAKTDGFNGFIL